MNTAPHAHHYHVPQPSLYPFILSGGMFTLALGFVLKMNGFAPGPWIMLAGVGVILYVLFGWFGKVIGESQAGAYRDWEDQSFRYGMIWFIASEVMFFAAFFGALFYMRTISVPELGNMVGAHGTTIWPDFSGTWPSAGPKGPQFTPMGAWGIPAINTALLLSSGVTLTIAHHALLAGQRARTIAFMWVTVLLGVVFLCVQGYEYYHAYADLNLKLSSGVYGSTFFMLTGFHGFHVLVGMLMLLFITLRLMKGHFTPQRHFGFEGAAWYWHFVDVVWLGLYFLVYWL